MPANPTLLVAYLHGASGIWDEALMLGLSALIGVALAYVMRSGKPRQ